MVALGLLMLPLPFVDGFVLLAVFLFLAGFAISPTLIASFAWIEESVPSARLTEGITLFTTGMAAGLAPGAALVGLVVDSAGASASYWVTAAAGAAGVPAWPLLTRTAGAATIAHRIVLVSADPAVRTSSRLGHRQVGQPQLAAGPPRHQPDRGSRQAAVRDAGRQRAAAGAAAGTGRSAGPPACPRARAGSRAAARRSSASDCAAGPTTPSASATRAASAT